MAPVQGKNADQQFLDTQQYTNNGILRYEKIFGKHFISTGGLDTTKEFVSMLDLQPGQRVLDVGAGIDLSTNMIALGNQRLAEEPDERVTLQITDATKVKFEPESFDVIYSRDAIIHIGDKKALFESFYRWLKPGGKVLISDYCHGPPPHSVAFQQYVAQRDYQLLTPMQYGQVLETVGFRELRAKDNTEMFKACLTKEIAATKAVKEGFIREFSQKDYDDIVDGWSDKLERVASGDQRWGLFYAVKL